MPGPNRYLDRPLTKVRRKDRELSDADWIDTLLHMAPVGHVAISHDGQPLLHSNLFWFDGERLYLHGAPAGKLRAVLELGETAGCFSVTEQGRILPAGTPFDFSVEYASVVCYGTLCLVTNPAEKRRGLEGLMAKYAPHLTAGVDYQAMPDADVAQTSVYRFDVESRVGKHNVKPEDYAAYPYPAGSFIEAERAAGRLVLKPKELA